MAKETQQPNVVAQTVLLPIGKIETNHGQVDGLPKNPRVLRDRQYEKLKRSIQENPEMLTLRELLVYPHGDKYIVIGGNMRLRVLKDMGEKAVPCKVIPADTPVEKLAAYVIKDNVSGGEWDWDSLANEWDTDKLDMWGLDVPNVEAELEKAKKGEIEGEIPFTEVLNEEHNYIVLYFDNNVDWLQAQGLFGIQPVKALPTKKGGNAESFGEKFGVGRVINGAQALENLRKQYEQ